MRVRGVPVVRPLRVTDEASLHQFVRNLCPESRYSRFMMAIRELPEDMLATLISVAQRNGIAHVHADVLAHN